MDSLSLAASGAARAQGCDCNLTSNLEALEDQLREATWCDETVLSAHPADSEPVERLFRLYGVLFLLLDQCAMDLRDIWSAVDGSKRREPRRSGERVIGDFTNDANHIWKHRRDRHDRTGRRMHYDHHHGPYVFEGVPAEEVAEAGGRALLVVPSLTAAARSLADALRYTDGVMARSDALERVVAEYGVQCDGDAARV